MKLVMISDTHGDHGELNVPDGDVLIHCGDYSATGAAHDLVYFNTWLGTLPHKHKLVVSGNHDGYAENNNYLARKLFFNATYLENEMVEIDGYKFWGSPITPEFNNWHFMRKRGDEIARVWEQIPDNIDVLITHGPPLGILDQIDAKNVYKSQHLGCYDLLYHTKRVKPKIHCFGHIHGGYGIMEVEGTKFINCASMTEMYSIEHEPLVAEI